MGEGGEEHRGRVQRPEMNLDRAAIAKRKSMSRTTRVTLRLADRKTKTRSDAYAEMKKSEQSP